MEFNAIFKAINETLENKDLKIWCQRQEISELEKKVAELEHKLAEANGVLDNGKL